MNFHRLVDSIDKLAVRQHSLAAHTSCLLILLIACQPCLSKSVKYATFSNRQISTVDTQIRSSSSATRLNPRFGSTVYVRFPVSEHVNLFDVKPVGKARFSISEEHSAALSAATMSNIEATQFTPLSGGKPQATIFAEIQSRALSGGDIDSTRIADVLQVAALTAGGNSYRGGSSYQTRVNNEH